VNYLFQNDWSLIPLINAKLHGALTLTMLWTQRGANRMLIPNLLFVVFGRFDHFNTRAIMVLSAVLYALSFWLYLMIHRASTGRHLGPVAILLTGGVWFSFEDCGSALWGFQLAWFLIIFFLMTLLFLFSRRRVTNLGLTLAILASAFRRYKASFCGPLDCSASHGELMTAAD